MDLSKLPEYDRETITKTGWKGDRYQVIEKYYYIYKLTNLDNGKIYIGKTTNPKKRAEFHDRELRHHNHKNCLLNADADCHFEMEIIESHITYRDSSKREKHYMEVYRTWDEAFGYNARDNMVQGIRRQNGFSWKNNCKYLREKKAVI